MRPSRISRRVRTLAAAIEELEPRQLLSATSIKAVPTQALTVGAGPSTINLKTYLNDPSITGGTVIQMQTPLGNIPLQLTDAQTPNTVANFVKYIQNSDYSPTLFQRLSPGFVLQGGGTKPDGSSNASLGNIASEAGLSNAVGTIAMALSNGPDTGNNQWFINLQNNASILDGANDGGPFTVFGNVIDGGMNVVNAIAQLRTINGQQENPNWYIGTNPNGQIDGLPVINYTGSTTPTTVPQANLVTDNIVTLTAAQVAPAYTIVTANPAVITASLNNGVLTIAPAAGVSSGSTTITATVTDFTGAKATQSFTVNVQTLPAVTIGSASASAGTDAQINFPVTLAAATTTDVTLNYSLAGGSAPAGDYAATGNTVTIPAGSTTASIPVNVIGNSTQTAETFGITLSLATTNATFTGGNATAVGTILPSAVTTSTVLASSVPAINLGGTVTFTATVTSSVPQVATNGIVTFTADGTTIGTQALFNGVATLTTTLTTAGNINVVANYGGSNNTAPSVSNTLTVNVSKLTPLVHSSTLPGSVIAGTAVNGALVVVVGNYGTTPSVGPLTVHVFASTNGVIDANSILVQTIKKKFALKAGQASAVSVPIHLAASKLGTGSYTFLPQTIDAAGTVADGSSGPGLGVIKPNVTLSADFVNLFLPTAVVAGSKTPMVARVSITNNGNSNYVGSTKVEILTSPDGTAADGTVFQTSLKTLSIRAGKIASVTVPLRNYPMVAEGNYFIVARVTDSLGDVATADSATTVNIAAARTDLMTRIIAIPATATAGKPFNVTLNLTNAGNNVVTGVLQIAFSGSTASDGTGPVAFPTVSTKINLKPGQSKPLHLKVTMPTTVTPGNLYLVAVIDPTGVFGDVDAANNTSVSPSFITVG